MKPARRQFILACGGALFSPAAPAAGRKRVNGVEIPVPPEARPRLYLAPANVAELGIRLAHPALRAVVRQIESDAARSVQRKVEWDALRYLVSPDPAEGQRIIENCLRMVRECELPDRSDACRVTGRMMVTGAMIYDWLYPLLTAGQKQAFTAEFVRLAGTQECGYPPTKQGSVTGHASEAQIMRDMISAGIAMYDEDPEMYDLAAGRFFAEHLPARNWFYPGHAYHQGDSYGPYRYSWDVFPLFIFDRLGAGNIYNPEQRGVPYYFLYATRPDGQRLRAGDTYSHSAPRGRPWSEGLGTVLTASYYHDGVLLSHHLRQQSAGGENAIFEFLWRDPDLPVEPIEDLPLSRYFGSPFGWMIARTGWDADAVIAEMKINEYYFSNHQHLDAGAFQIYYKGALAIDSGLYNGQNGAYGSEHCRNYYWRTIAHNALLIHDPQENFGSDGYGNDGGQRLPNRRFEPRTLEVLRDEKNGYRTGEVLAHGFGPSPAAPDYTLLQGDITRAYGPKAKLVRRSSVFLNLRDKSVPAALIVFDRVIASDPAFRKYWLLHALEEPRLDGASAVIDVTEHDSRGRLFLNALLPPAAEVSKVGGAGLEFPVFGKNYPNEPDPQLRERGSAELGAWRIEISPGRPAAEDLFLNVMQVADRDTPQPWPAALLEFGERVGCALHGPDGFVAVLFRKDAARSHEPVRFEVAAPGTCRMLIADLAAGLWRAAREGSAGSIDVQAPEDSGAVWLEGQGGTWTLQRVL